MLLDMCFRLAQQSRCITGMLLTSLRVAGRSSALICTAGTNLYAVNATVFLYLQAERTCSTQRQRSGPLRKGKRATDISIHPLTQPGVGTKFLRPHNFWWWVTVIMALRCSVWVPPMRSPWNALLRCRYGGLRLWRLYHAVVISGAPKQLFLTSVLRFCANGPLKALAYGGRERRQQTPNPPTKIRGPFGFPFSRPPPRDVLRCAP